MANVEMFKKIKRQWDSEPETVDMGTWEFPESKAKAEVDELGDMDVAFYNGIDGEYFEIPLSACGTTRCVAGWAIHFKAEELGLDLTKDLQALSVDVRDAMGSPSSAFDELGKEILEIDNANLFFTDDETAYEVVSEYAAGERG